ncbi:MAG: oligosaccharide flippase family protein [Muribaculaceae bacterium]|nr:oligosaccharide flippase family protein [Muribaculaceae bacterium]
MAQQSKNNITNGVLKALGIFGGVQMITIICSILRTKLIAVWIGAAGVGLFGIFNSAIELLGVLFHLGVRDSAVRDIASSQQPDTNKIITIVRRWVLILGAIGLVATMAISPLLSNFTFGNYDYTYAFIAIAFIILLSSIQNGELAILQGTKELSRLAKASIWGAIGGVIISIPLFYFWRIDSVIPALVAYSVITTIAILSQRVSTPKPTPCITFSETMSKGRSFISLGIFLTISAVVNHLVSFLFITYLNHVGDTSVVGHYQAGITLVNKYMGIIFTAIIMEYYPRLSQVSSSQKRTSIFVSHEISIMLWILLPVIAIFIASSELIISLLYSSEFLLITPFVVWAVIGTIFRAISWCMAYVILTRGDGKVYLVTESLSAITCITLNILAYNFWGLEGLGFAYMAWYIIYTIIIGAVYRVRYSLRLNGEIIRLAAIAVSAIVISAVGFIYVGWYISAIVGLVFTPIAYRRITRRRLAK